MKHPDDYDRDSQGVLLLRRKTPAALLLSPRLWELELERATAAQEQWQARERIRQLRESAGVRDTTTLRIRKPMRYGAP